MFKDIDLMFKDIDLMFKDIDEMITFHYFRTDLEYYFIILFSDIKACMWAYCNLYIV